MAGPQARAAETGLRRRRHPLCCAAIMRACEPLAPRDIAIRESAMVDGGVYCV